MVLINNNNCPPLHENWTLMVGEGGGWAKITKIIMAFFGNFMVELYLNNGLMA